MLLCNPAIKQPSAALMQPYRIYPIRQIPYRNPVILRSGNQSTNQVYLTPQNDSILNQGHFISEHIFCQSTQNTLTVFRVNVTSRQTFTTWQAVCRSGPARNFCTGSLGTPFKPRDHTSCELRVFFKTLRLFLLVTAIRSMMRLNFFQSMLMFKSLLLLRQYYLRLPYCSSSTGSHHSVLVFSPGISWAICWN